MCGLENEKLDYVRVCEGWSPRILSFISHLSRYTLDFCTKGKFDK